MTECAVDGRPSSDAFLCHGCLDALKVELRAIPWLVEQLEVTLTRQARVGRRNGPRSTERPLPFHVNAAVDLETLRDGLGMWATTVAEVRALRVDAVGSVTCLSVGPMLMRGGGARRAARARRCGDRVCCGAS